MTHNPPTPVSVESLQGLLSTWFAPWVQALGLEVESFADGEVTLRLPQSDQLSRVGGMLCGQAMMSAADTAMVLAIVTQLGDQRPMTTVQQHQRPQTTLGPGRPRHCARDPRWQKPGVRRNRHRRSHGWTQRVPREHHLRLAVNGLP